MQLHYIIHLYMLMTNKHIVESSLLIGVPVACIISNYISLKYNVPYTIHKNKFLHVFVITCMEYLYASFTVVIVFMSQYSVEYCYLLLAIW